MVKRFFAVLVGLMLLGSSLGVFAEENFSEEQQPMVVAEVINGEVVYTLNDGNQVEKADFEGVISEKYANEDLYNYLHKAFSEHKEEINVKEYSVNEEKLLAVMKKVIAENADCSTVVADNCYFVKSGEIIKEIQVIYREMPTEFEPELKEDLYEAIRGFMISGKQTWIKITDAPLNVGNSVDFTDKNYILSVEEMEWLINRVIYLNGEYCWISGNYGWNFYNIGDKKYVSAFVVYPGNWAKSEEEVAVKHIEAEADNILSQIDEDMLDIEKALFVHEYFMIHNNYASEEEFAKYKYNAYGALVRKQGVCAGTTKAYSYLMNRLGIENTYALSQKAMNHVWNVIKLDGVWYYIDATWDDFDELGRSQHEYFLLSGEELFKKSHYGWDYKCETRDTYDTAVWKNYGTMIYAEDWWYFVQGGYLKRYSFRENTTEIIANLGVNTTLAYLNNRLFYSKGNVLYSIKTDGTDNRIEINGLETGEIRGIAEQYGSLIIEVKNTAEFLRFEPQTGGLFEYDYWKSRATHSFESGDVDKNGEVGVTDLVWVYRCLNKENSVNTADINGDGVVNIIDFSMLKKMLLE